MLVTIFFLFVVLAISLVLFKADSSFESLFWLVSLESGLLFYSDD